MSELLNITWFIFGSEILALAWLIIGAVFYRTIIGVPIGRACFEFAKLTAFPFGKEIIKEKELKSGEISESMKVAHIILNTIWFPIGIVFALVHLTVGILSSLSIVGIPAGIAHVRMAKFSIFPIGARVVTKKKAQAVAPAEEVVKRINK